MHLALNNLKPFSGSWSSWWCRHYFLTFSISELDVTGVIDVTGEGLLWAKLGFSTDVNPCGGEVRSAHRMNVYFLPFEFVKKNRLHKGVKVKGTDVLWRHGKRLSESTFRPYAIGKWNSCFSKFPSVTHVLFAVLALPIFVYYYWPWMAYTHRPIPVYIVAVD